MRKLILYTAISLDGFIARSDGNIDWLQDPAWTLAGEDYGYSDLMKTVDTTLMGGNTFRQLDDFDIPFPYSDKENFVFTRRTGTGHEHVSFVRENFTGFVESLKKKKGRDIWLIGGGQLNGILHGYDLIDEYRLTFMPVFLGDGIPLFRHYAKEMRLRLISSRSYPNGIVFNTFVPNRKHPVP
jgi:dihydrofolate reductase